MEKQTIKKKLIDWCKENRLVLLYVLFAIAIEMLAVFAVEGTPFLSRPFMAIGLLIFVTGIVLLIKSEQTRLIVCAVLLAVQAIMGLVFAVIYDMTGQYFYYEMINLRNDAVAALESIPMNFMAFYSGLFFCVMFVIYGLRKNHEKKTLFKNIKRSAWLRVTVMFMGLVTFMGSFMCYYPRSSTAKYDEMINGKSNGLYSSYGMIGNLFGEIGCQFWQEDITFTDEEVNNFLYAPSSVSQPTEYFGVAKDKNVVMVLAESFEWFTFMLGEEYPNTLPFTADQLAEFYPNLTRLYNGSAVATNFHSREKTDISETLSIAGNYPLEAYVSYNYASNVMPMTVPNMLQLFDNDIQCRSFHNGDKEFYNRIVTHNSFGLGNMMDKFDMAKYAKQQAGEGEKPTFTNYDETDELNLDSEMIETCKDLMFPKDKRFYTYITTISMHGVYYKRDNLADKRLALEAVLAEYYGEDAEMKTENEEEESPYCYMDKEEEILFHYMVTGLELDAALGVLFADLEQKELLDKTTIMLFGDHNAYYQTLSSYVKDIDNYHTDNYFTDLYKVPLMIYDSDIPAQKIDKFTCTSDMVPTLLDLLGVKYYDNMYYGHSIFSDKESALYSRAYGVWVQSGIVGTSVNNIVYRHDSVTNSRLDSFKTEATLLVEKMKYCDYLFDSDYFSDGARLKKFQDNIRMLNA